MIAFSSDIDWAPEPVIEDIISIFEQYTIPCTLFATHSSPVVMGCNRKLFEIGIHPNFNGLLEGKGGSVDAILDDLLNQFPEAKGVRSHSLTQNSRILQKFSERGLEYDANEFFPYHSNLHCWQLWNGIVRVPFNWGDDVHYMFNKQYNDCGLRFVDDALNILNFHPIHVFLNTENAARYEAAKQHYGDVASLEKHKNKTGEPGTRDLLLNLLEKAKADGMQTVTLGAISERFLQSIKISHSAGDNV